MIQCHNFRLNLEDNALIREFNDTKCKNDDLNILNVHF